MNITTDHDKGQGMRELEMTRVICDGCAVNPPHEHRCHGLRAYVNGEAMRRPCDCRDCDNHNFTGPWAK